MVDKRTRKACIGISVALVVTLALSADRTLADNQSDSASNSCFRLDPQNESFGAVPCNVSRLKAAAKSGQAFAQNQLGLVSAVELEKGRNIRDARSWFERAARRGYAPAQVNLAVIYINGWGTLQNYGAALNWL